MNQSFVTERMAHFFLGKKIPNQHIHAVVACMPSSGSTYLTRLIANLPDMEIAHLVPGYGSREQELAVERLNLFHENNYVAQHHLRYSKPTQHLMDIFSIKPVVLIRNLFDVIMSLHDNIAYPLETPMVNVPSDILNWDDTKKYLFIVDMILPWYFNFYNSWIDAADKIVVTYEELNVSPGTVLKKVVGYLGISASQADIKTAISNSTTQFTRKNRGILGRGQSLPDCIKQKVITMSEYCSNVDMCDIGLGSALPHQEHKSCCDSSHNPKQTSTDRRKSLSDFL